MATTVMCCKCTSMTQTLVCIALQLWMGGCLIQPMACGYLLALIHLGNCALAALKMAIKLNEFGSCFACQHARPLGHVPLQHGPQFAGLLSQVNSCVVCVGCLSPFPSGKLGSMHNTRLRCAVAMAARGDWAWGAGSHTAGF